MMQCVILLSNISQHSCVVFLQKTLYWQVHKCLDIDKVIAVSQYIGVKLQNAVQKGAYGSKMNGRI